MTQPVRPKAKRDRGLAFRAFRNPVCYLAGLQGYSSVVSGEGESRSDFVNEGRRYWLWVVAATRSPAKRGEVTVAGFCRQLGECGRTLYSRA
jgi:hypothetical protein